MGEGDGQIEIDEEILEDLEAGGAAAERAVRGGGEHGHAPGGDGVGHGNGDAGAAVAVGDDFGIDVERFGEVGAHVRGGGADGGLGGEGRGIEIGAHHGDHLFHHGNCGSVQRAGIELAGREDGTGSAPASADADAARYAADDPAEHAAGHVPANHDAAGSYLLHDHCFHRGADVQDGGEHGPVAHLECHGSRRDLKPGEDRRTS